MSDPNVILGQEIGRLLDRAGIVPPNCVRIVLDISVNDVPKVYYQCNGDERLLNVDWTGIKAKLDGLNAEGQPREPGLIPAGESGG